MHKPERHMPTWEVQWKRVERYYQRFQDMNDGFTAHGEPSNYHYDDMLAFFQNCFHLRDWLKNDNFTSQKHNNVDPCRYVRNTTSLAICADLANGTKHMCLVDKPKSGCEPKMATRQMEATGGSKIIHLRAKIEHGGKMIDAFTLATECMKAWKQYLF